MDAIGEFIAGLVEAMVHAAISLLELVLIQTGLLFEFFLLALTEGISAAAETYTHHRSESAERRQHAKQARKQAKPGARSSLLKNSALCAAAALFVVLCGTVVVVARNRMSKQRIAETRSQVEQLADSLVAKVKDDETDNPQLGKLPERDAWQQPLELDLEETLFGSVVVVRSSGPDRQAGTNDDIVETRVARASAKAIGGQLVKRGVQAMRERVQRLLPGGDQEPLPEDGASDEQ